MTKITLTALNSKGTNILYITSPYRPPNMTKIYKLTLTTPIEHTGALDYIFHPNSKMKKDVILAIHTLITTKEYKSAKDANFSDYIVFYVTSLVHWHSKEIKLLIVEQFLKFINSNHDFSAVLSKNLLGDGLAIIIDPKQTDPIKTIVLIERLFAALTCIDKSNRSDILIVYLFIAMFCTIKSVMKPMKELQITKVVSHFHSLLFLNWYNKFSISSNRIDNILSSTLTGLDGRISWDKSNDGNNIEIIFAYAKIALYLLFIEMDRVSHQHNSVEVLPIVKDLAKACSSAIIQAFKEEGGV